MEKRIFTVLLMAVFILQAMSQNLKGKVVDNKGIPIAFANVLLISKGDSAFIAGSVTKEDGSFELQSSNKNMMLKVSSIGYKTIYEELKNYQGKPICLEEDAKILNEVVVKGHRSQYKMTNEGLLTHVDGTVLSKMGTAEDVLKHVPGIIKRGDVYEVLGKGTPLIYINNRKVLDVNDLDNLKSSAVKSVEVIQAPGAIYGASVNAVIKIKTIPAKGDGFSFDTRSLYSYNKYSGTIQELNTNYRHDGLNLFATYKFSNTKTIQDATFEQITYVDEIWKQNNSNFQTRRSENHLFIGGFCYDFSANHSIGARYTLNSPGYRRTHSIFNSKITVADKFYDDIATNSAIVNKDNPDHQLNFYYNGRVGKTTIGFDTDLYFAKNRMYSYFTEKSQEQDSRQIDSKNKVNNKMVASKLVLTSPVLGGWLTYGAEYINTHRNDDYEVNRTDLLANSYGKLEEQTVSPFLQYSHLTSIGNVTAGLRYENVRFRYYNDGIYHPEQSRSFNNIFPSLTYGTKIGKAMLQLSYSIKTKRPTYSQLSNNIVYMNRLTLQKGNPQLNNETNHMVEVSGVWKFIQFMVNYKDSRDAIIYWAEQIPDNEAITMVNHKNLKSVKSATAYVSLAPKFGFWSPQANLAMLKQWFTLHTDVESYKLNRPIFMATFNNAFRLPCDIVFNVNYRYQSKGNVQNVFMAKEQHVLDVSISKSFLQNALTLELQGNDLLYKNWDADLLYNQKMTLLQVARRGTRNLNLTLRYKFNSTRSKYKGTGAGNSEIKRL